MTSHQNLATYKAKTAMVTFPLYTKQHKLQITCATNVQFPREKIKKINKKLF